jgi:hypothetical protein
VTKFNRCRNKQGQIALLSDVHISTCMRKRGRRGRPWPWRRQVYESEEEEKASPCSQANVHLIPIAWFLCFFCMLFIMTLQGRKQA